MTGRKRRVLTIVGVTSSLAGIVALTGAVGGLLWLRSLLRVAGVLLAGAIVLHGYRQWRGASGDEPPAVESTPPAGAPGDEFDRTIGQFDGSGTGLLSERTRAHDRLRTLAAGVLARRRGCSREAALERIDAGAWPRDPTVSRFLRDVTARPGRDWTERLRGRLTDGPSAFQQQVALTVDELSAQAEFPAIDNESDGESRIRDGDGSDRPSRATANSSGPPVGAITTTVGDRDWGIERPLPWQRLPEIGLGFVGLGLALRTVPLVLAGAVPLGVLAVARGLSAPPATVRIDRSIDPLRPAAGETVEVTTTVRNDGSRTVPDLRVIAGVPPDLEVLEGSPRHGTALRPGERTTFSYSVRARRGVHEFGPAAVAVGDGLGYSTRTEAIEASDGSDVAVTCIPPVAAAPVSVPLVEHGSESLGRIPAGGGDGTAFYATREYRSGDPTTRIDWKRVARSPAGELSTIQYHEERAATVVLAIEADAGAYLAPDPDGPTAVERSITAARKLCGSLLATGDRVGVAAVGPTPCWLAPGTGVEHVERVERTLATDDAFPVTAPDSEAFSPHWVREFHRRFPAEAQVVLFSPLCASRYRFVVAQLRAHGHPVTVVSPDPTVDRTVGQRLRRLERRLRIETLRKSGVRVIDWKQGTPLAVALERAAARWSG